MLTWLGFRVPDTWSNIILGVPTRVFRDEITFELVDWADCPPLCRWPSSNESLTRTKEADLPSSREEFCQPDCWAGILFYSCLQTGIKKWVQIGIKKWVHLGSQACWPLDWTFCHQLSWFRPSNLHWRSWVSSCWLYTLGFLCHYNCLSQFLIM